MCGRYTLAATSEELVEAFDVPNLDFDLRPSWNIAPGRPSVVVVRDGAGRRAGLVTWGLVPAWWSARGRPHVNARSESILDKPSFREAFRSRRCLVPADGFYEWRRDGGGKTPFWFYPPGGGLVSFAAVWERWQQPGGAPFHGFAILTASANPDVSAVHDRMPVVIGAADRASWLGAATTPETAAALLSPAAPGTFSARQVSGRVNRAAEDDAGLTDAVG